MATESDILIDRYNKKSLTFINGRSASEVKKQKVVTQSEHVICVKHQNRPLKNSSAGHLKIERAIAKSIDSGIKMENAIDKSVNNDFELKMDYRKMGDRLYTRFSRSGACSLKFLVVLLFFVSGVSSQEDYCSRNTFVTNSTWLQFTKEVTSMEYAVVNKYKSLHCCAKGYRSIEWYKDDRAYPWPREVSSFILYPEAANQTVYTQHATDADRGNYTCLMRNDTHIHVHTVMVVLVEKPPPAPRATFTPQDQWVELGQLARLYCEAFVGRINLPDTTSDIYWKRVHPEGIKKPRRTVRLQQNKVIREGEQILGAYLIIPEMKPEDYGEYVCTVSNADSFIEMQSWLHHKVTPVGVQNNSVPWRILCLVAVGIILAMITIGVMYAKFGLGLALRWRHAGHSYTNDDKEYDVLVLYTEVDSSLTLEILIPTLQNKYSYKCINCQVPRDSASWCSVVGRLALMSRSVVAVLSPNEMTPSELTAALSQLHRITTNPRVVLLQGYDRVRQTPKDSNGENLHSMLKKTRLIPWRQLDDKNFWIVLRLSLPPPYSTRFNRTDKSNNSTAAQRLSADMENHQVDYEQSLGETDKKSDEIMV